ncbi:hypothetical protein HN670_03360 [bacterium]|jgi:hypothetical protein|nr:hypothetical protein [bacterium]
MSKNVKQDQRHYIVEIDFADLGFYRANFKGNDNDSVSSKSVEGAIAKLFMLLRASLKLTEDEVRTVSHSDDAQIREGLGELECELAKRGAQLEIHLLLSKKRRVAQ